jgi:hypothetical protein
MTYARKEWQEERTSWRAVIQLNLVRNVNTILDILTEEMSSRSDSELSNSPSFSASARSSLPIQFTEKHRLLKLRVGPLRRIQKDLERRLGAAVTEVQSTTVMTAAPFDSFSDTFSDTAAPEGPVLREFSINSSNGWKTALDRFRSGKTSGVPTSAPKRGWDAELDEITGVIASCKDDMKAIWEDPMVRTVLSKRNVRLDETPGLCVCSFAPLT